MIPFTWNGRRERNLIRGPVSIVGSGLGGLQSRPLQSSLGLTDPRCWACGGYGVKSLGVVVEDSQEKITCPTSQAGGRGTVRTLMGRSLAVGSHKRLKTKSQRWIFMLPRATLVLPQPCLCGCSQVTTDIHMGGKSWSKKELQPFLSPGLCSDKSHMRHCRQFSLFLKWKY